MTSPLYSDFVGLVRAWALRNGLQVTDQQIMDLRKTLSIMFPGDQPRPAPPRPTRP